MLGSHEWSTAPFEMLPAIHWLNWLALTLVPVVSFVAAGHALLYKRDPRSAFGWIAVCLMFPLAGALLYFLFGINRVRTRARELRAARSSGTGLPEGAPERRDSSGGSLGIPSEFTELARISSAITRRALLRGNRIDALHNGEQAYPAMLDAIATAERSVYLSAYIFDTNDTGKRFIDALAGASERGLDVRVILDGFGEHYSFPRAGRLLRQRGIRFVRFLPFRWFPPALHINLRNHRKILVIDHAVAFTGGMNIGDRHLADTDRADRVVDMHFRLAGPIVSQMRRAFVEDWNFCTGADESVDSTSDVAEHEEPLATHAGNAVCRMIVDGPDEDLDKLSTVLIAAISAARSNIRIMTPYFIPSSEMTLALESAALRGVAVSVVIPQRSNLPFVNWATRNMLWEILQRKVRVFFQPPPFVHTKLFVVDDFYTLIGSANLDPRSLRLNFEIAVEVYDGEFAAGLAGHIDETARRSREVHLEDVENRSMLARTRDALAWLFSPYL